MRSFSSLRVPAIALFILATAFSSSAQPAETAVAPATPVQLFNGRNLSGWTFVSRDTNTPAASIWSVTNGVIVCRGKPPGYARTVRIYRDYRLHAEWRFPAGPGNSGIFLHLHPPDKVWPYCFEVQLLSGDAGEVRMNGGSKANGTTPKHPNFIPRREPSPEKPVGEWNSCNVMCRSNTITVRINGVLQNQVTGTSVSSGAVGLQAEGKPVEFRNVQIEPLP